MEQNKDWKNFTSCRLDRTKARRTLSNFVFALYLNLAERQPNRKNLAIRYISKYALNKCGKNDSFLSERPKINITFIFDAKQHLILENSVADRVSC